jgi:hypothetical protein
MTYAEKIFLASQCYTELATIGLYLQQMNIKTNNVVCKTADNEFGKCALHLSTHFNSCYGTCVHKCNLVHIIFTVFKLS